MSTQPSIIVDEIEQDSAKATVEINNETGDEKIIYLQYYKTADKDAPNKNQTEVNDKTTTAPLNFTLSPLNPATRCTADASLVNDFLDFRTESYEFVTKPGEPKDVTVTSGNQQLEVSWTKPDGGDAVDSYKVQWKESAVSGWTTPSEEIVTDLTYTISDLDYGTEYTVRVWAVNAEGETVSDEVDGSTIPDAPMNLNVSPGDEKLILTWEAPSETDSADISEYVVEYKEGTAQTWTTNNEAVETETSSGTTTYSTTMPDLTNDTLHDVRVRANNGALLDDKDDYNWSDDATGTPVPNPSIGIISVKANLRLTLR